MKQLLWNLVKWTWVLATSYGYFLYFTQTLSADLTILWISAASIILAGSYSFLSGYRLGPSTILGEFLPQSEISEINYNQWLFGAWVVLSLGIMIPAYEYRPAWVIIAPSLLVLGIVIVVSITSCVGRYSHSIVRKGLMDY